MTDRLDAQHWTEWRVLRSWLLATALILTLLGAVTTKAQVLYGTLTGRITDQTGAVVPNVTVTITSQDTGAVRTATSSEQGDYRVTNLLPGSYTLSLAQSGFADFTQKNIVLEINREVRVDAILQPAANFLFERRSEMLRSPAVQFVVHVPLVE